MGALGQSKNQTTRVFRAGNSLAVRIPKAFEIPEGEVVIEQRDGGLFINTRRGKWAEFFDSLKPTDWLDAPNDFRDNDALRPVDSSWLSVG
jgi:virulence-associated protein VagC